MDPARRTTSSTQSNDCADIIHMLKEVRRAGHEVEVLAATGVEFQRIFVSLGKARHARLKKERKKKGLDPPPALKIKDLKASPQYKHRLYSTCNELQLQL